MRQRDPRNKLYPLLSHNDTSIRMAVAQSKYAVSLLQMHYHNPHSTTLVFKSVVTDYSQIAGHSFTWLSLDPPNPQSENNHVFSLDPPLVVPDCGSFTWLSLDPPLVVPDCGSFTWLSLDPPLVVPGSFTWLSLDPPLVVPGSFTWLSLDPPLVVPEGNTSNLDTCEVKAPFLGYSSFCLLFLHMWYTTGLL